MDVYTLALLITVQINVLFSHPNKRLPRLLLTILSLWLLLMNFKNEPVILKRSDLIENE